MLSARRLCALAALLLAPLAHAQPAPLQGLALVDHHQRPLEAKALRGHPVLMHFVYTTCSSSCPLQVHDLAQVLAALAPEVRERVRLVSVTVDPLQDTPASLAAFARRLDADRPGWHFVTGDPKQVFALADRLQVRDPKRPRTEDHRTSLYLYDAAGTLMQRYAGTPVDKPRLVAELTQIARLPSPTARP